MVALCLCRCVQMCVDMHLCMGVYTYTCIHVYVDMRVYTGIVGNVNIIISPWLVMRFPQGPPLCARKEAETHPLRVQRIGFVRRYDVPDILLMI